MPPKNYKVTIIAAMNQHRVIGVNGQIPWKIPSEMKFFKDTTTGHPVIMGRLTWESLPPKYRPLPDRLNYIVTTDDAWVSRPQDVGVANCIEAAIDDIRRVHRRYEDEIFIIGGGQIYKDAIVHNLASRVLLNVVKGHDDVTEGVMFPELKGWERIACEEHASFVAQEFRPVLHFDKISEIAMDLSLKLTDLGIEGYEYNECMNYLRSRLVESFEMNSVPHDGTTMGRVDWIKLREERKKHGHE